MGLASGALDSLAIVQQASTDDGSSGSTADDDGGVATDDSTTPSCDGPDSAWLDTLQSAFYAEYRDAAINDAAYVEQSTDQGTAYYVAVSVEGVSGVAVFSTSDPPLQADPGLIAAANSAASQLSDLGADISPDSPAGTLLLDSGGISAAESCLS